MCLVWRVVDSGRVLGAGSNMGCYLEDYVGTLAARTVWRAQGRNITGQVRSDLANTYVSVGSGFGDTVSHWLRGTKSLTWCGG